MLDVHSPHERIHGFRDFLLHLLTITIGLLIALGLEGCVEWSHHRHLRQEADANLHQEIRDNKKELAETRSSIANERENLINVLKFLEARSLNQHYNIHRLSLNFNLATLRTRVGERPLLSALSATWNIRMCRAMPLPTKFRMSSRQYRRRRSTSFCSSSLTPSSSSIRTKCRLPRQRALRQTSGSPSLI